MMDCNDGTVMFYHVAYVPYIALNDNSGLNSPLKSSTVTM